MYVHERKPFKKIYEHNFKNSSDIHFHFKNSKTNFHVPHLDLLMCSSKFSWIVKSSGSTLFIKTNNHVRACPLLKHPCIRFIFAQIKQYTYKSNCFKIHFHTYTRVQKQIHKLYITCVQTSGNAKIWPYNMYIIKSWTFSYKVVKDFFITWMKFVHVCFKLAKAITVSNSTII